MSFFSVLRGGLYYPGSVFRALCGYSECIVPPLRRAVRSCRSSPGMSLPISGAQSCIRMGTLDCSADLASNRAHISSNVAARQALTAPFALQDMPIELPKAPCSLLPDIAEQPISVTLQEHSNLMGNHVDAPESGSGRVVY